MTRDDLLAPYAKHSLRRHEELRRLLRSKFGIALEFEDFLAEADDEAGPAQSIVPLGLVTLAA